MTYSTLTRTGHFVDDRALPVVGLSTRPDDVINPFPRETAVINKLRTNELEARVKRRPEGDETDPTRSNI